jgi:hypothetical protein
VEGTTGADVPPAKRDILAVIADNLTVEAIRDDMRSMALIMHCEKDNANFWTRSNDDQADQCRLARAIFKRFDLNAAWHLVRMAGSRCAKDRFPEHDDHDMVTKEKEDSVRIEKEISGQVSDGGSLDAVREIQMQLSELNNCPIP